MKKLTKINLLIFSALTLFHPGRDQTRLLFIQGQHAQKHSGKRQFTVKSWTGKIIPNLTTVLVVHLL